MSEQPLEPVVAGLQADLDNLVMVLVKAIVMAYQTQSAEHAMAIQTELKNLPDTLTTEVLNSVILRLVKVDPTLCRWFILDVFLRDADPEGKADVAERINLLLADLQSPTQGQSS